MSSRHPRRHAPTVISLFSSAGIGELGLEAAGFEVLLANEIIPYRVRLHRENFPGVDVIEGDIWLRWQDIVSCARERLKKRELFLLYATPPCQGMSSNGFGKLQFEIEGGRRDAEEPRNRLIIPTLEIARELRPRFLLLENVPGMLRTAIRNEFDRPEYILDFISRQLGEEYVGCGEVLACEDYGIPQRRHRLITIFTRDPSASEYFRENGTFLDPSMRKAGATLREAIGALPALDAREGRSSMPQFHPQHRVPVMAKEKYWWVSHTPEGATAFNNQCVNRTCGAKTAPRHQEKLIEGKWTSVKGQTVFCPECGSLLPRPVVRLKDGSVRALRGFHSAYRRMRWDQTARTLTQNFIYEASDNKIHPDQNRVLSVLEAMILQTIDRYGYQFILDGADLGFAKIAEVIGESVPPYLMEQIAVQLQLLGEDCARPLRREHRNDTESAKKL